MPPEEEPATPALKQMKKMGFLEVDTTPVRISTGSILGISLFTLLGVIVLALDCATAKRDLKKLRKLCKSKIRKLKRFKPLKRLFKSRNGNLKRLKPVKRLRCEAVNLKRLKRLRKCKVGNNSDV